MAIEEMNHDERWVNERLASLEPDPGWRPDAAAAMQRLARRQRASGTRRNVICIAAAAALAVLVLGDMAPRACAEPRGCEQQGSRPAAALAAGSPLKLESPSKFKLEGNPNAPITIEIFSDYQCPTCAKFYNEIRPLLDAQYVQPGKAKVLHRDFPLPQHAYAKLAARYANAAGELGKYAAAVDALYRTQAIWSGDGNIAAALRFVLTPEEMNTVERLVKSDPRLDETAAEDMQVAQKDQIAHTPTLVVVSKNGRQPMNYYVSFDVLKTYLDNLLAQ